MSSSDRVPSPLSSQEPPVTSSSVNLGSIPGPNFEQERMTQAPSTSTPHGPPSGSPGPPPGSPPRSPSRPFSGPSSRASSRAATPISAMPSSFAAPIIEISDSLDPLSHLSHIFEKIRRQVIEWGEDANWKIDVFLLPNEDGTPGTGAHASDSATSRSSFHPETASSAHPPPSSSEVSENMPVQRIVILDSPRRPAREIQDVEMERDSGSPRFALQPPPSDLPMPTRDTIASSLREQDISGMSEAEAKHMLLMTLRQMRGQQEDLAQALHDLDAIQRNSAKRERDAEARLDAERRNMEQDAHVLSRKWKEASLMVMEKEREIRDVQMQLEQGKRNIRERNEERRRRIEEHGIILSRLPSAREGLGLVHSASMPLPGRTEHNQPFHHHRHRRVHYHRHHHRHLIKGLADAEATMAGTDSLDNLALLASQVLTREPLVISKKPYANNASPDSAVGAEYVARTEKKRIAPEERDQGLQLRPVKRMDLNGLEGEDQKAQEGKGSKGEISSSTSNGAAGSPKAISNGQDNMEGFSKKPQQRPSQQQHLQSQSYSSRPSVGGSFHQSGSGPSSSASRSGISGAKGVQGRPASKYRRT